MRNVSGKGVFEIMVEPDRPQMIIQHGACALNTG